MDAELAKVKLFHRQAGGAKYCPVTVLVKPVKPEGRPVKLLAQG